MGVMVAPLSLHRFQRRQRDSRLGLLRWKQQSGIAANASDASVLPGGTQSILANWASGETPPTAQVIDGGNVRFSFPVRTGDVTLRACLETDDDLIGPWQPVPEESLTILPTDHRDFSFYEIEPAAVPPRAFYRATFWRAEP